MFKLLRNNKGQGLAVQYSLTFFLVVAFVTAISVYVRRTLQARIRGAEKYVTTEIAAVLQDAELNAQGKYYAQYEAYYTNSQAIRTYNGSRIDRTIPGGTAGIDDTTIAETTIVNARMTQTAPKNAN